MVETSSYKERMKELEIEYNDFLETKHGQEWKEHWKNEIGSDSCGDFGEKNNTDAHIHVSPCMHEHASALLEAAQNQDNHLVKRQKDHINVENVEQLFMADTIIVWIVQKEKDLLRAIFKSGNEKFVLNGFKGEVDIE